MECGLCFRSLKTDVMSRFSSKGLLVADRARRAGRPARKRKKVEAPENRPPGRGGARSPLPIIGRKMDYSGSVKARTEMNLGFRVAGKITERLVDVGQRVQASAMCSQSSMPSTTSSPCAALRPISHLPRSRSKSPVLPAAGLRRCAEKSISSQIAARIGRSLPTTRLASQQRIGLVGARPGPQPGRLYRAEV